MSQQSTMGKKKLYPESNPGLSEKRKKPPEESLGFLPARVPGRNESARKRCIRSFGSIERNLPKFSCPAANSQFIRN